jgi:hypothetical protein
MANLWLIYPWKMVIFDSYICKRLPEGNINWNWPNEVPKLGSICSFPMVWQTFTSPFFQGRLPFLLFKLPFFMVELTNCCWSIGVNMFKQLPNVCCFTWLYLITGHHTVPCSRSIKRRKPTIYIYIYIPCVAKYEVLKYNFISSYISHYSIS